MSDGPLLLIIVIVGALLLLLGPLVYSALNEAGGHGSQHRPSTTRHTTIRSKSRSHKTQPRFVLSNEDDEDDEDQLEALFSELIQPHHQKRRK